MKKLVANVSALLGGLIIVIAVATNNVPLAIAGLGTLLLGLAAMVVYKLNEILFAIWESNTAVKNVETVLKQRLHI